MCMRFSFLKEVDLFCDWTPVFCHSKSFHLDQSNHFMSGIAIYLFKSSSWISSQNLTKNKILANGRAFLGYSNSKPIVRDLYSSWGLDSLYHMVETELIDWPKSLFTFQEIKVLYNEKSINYIFSTHTISPVFTLCLSHTWDWSFVVSYERMEQNPPNEEATESGWIRALLSFE